MRHVGPFRESGHGPHLPARGARQTGASCSTSRPPRDGSGCFASPEGRSPVYNVRPQAMARLRARVRGREQANSIILRRRIRLGAAAGPVRGEPGLPTDLMQGVGRSAGAVPRAGHPTRDTIGHASSTDSTVCTWCIRSSGGCFTARCTGRGQYRSRCPDVRVGGAVRTWGDHMGWRDVRVPRLSGPRLRPSSPSTRRPLRDKDGHVCACSSQRKAVEEIFRHRAIRAMHAMRRLLAHSVAPRISARCTPTCRCDGHATGRVAGLFEAADIRPPRTRMRAFLRTAAPSESSVLSSSGRSTTEGRIRRMGVPTAWSDSRPEPGGQCPHSVGRDSGKCCEKPGLFQM